MLTFGLLGAKATGLKRRFKSINVEASNNGTIARQTKKKRFRWYFDATSSRTLMHVNFVNSCSPLTCGSKYWLSQWNTHTNSIITRNEGIKKPVYSMFGGISGRLHFCRWGRRLCRAERYHLFPSTQSSVIILKDFHEQILFIIFINATLIHRERDKQSAFTNLPSRALLPLFQSILRHTIIIRALNQYYYCCWWDIENDTFSNDTFEPETLLNLEWHFWT